jgi:hypothetical protein
MKSSIKSLANLSKIGKTCANFSSLFKPPYKLAATTTSVISLASTSTPPAAEDHTRPRTARKLPAIFTVVPVPIRAPISRTPSPAITTPNLKISRPSPQFTSILITGVPVGVVRSSGAEAT